MNILVALRETYVIWNELSRTGSCNKLSIVFDTFSHCANYKNACPCCEYTCQRLHTYYVDCSICPIWDQYNMCEDENSCYSKWKEDIYVEENENPITIKMNRQKYAQELADLAKENYDLLISLGYTEDMDI